MVQCHYHLKREKMCAVAGGEIDQRAERKAEGERGKERVADLLNLAHG